MLLQTEAFEHRCLYTQKHLPRDALTYTRLYTQKLLDTDCFSENHRSFDTENLLHRESFTHKLFLRSSYTEKLLMHRSFYTQTPLHTEACTHGGFYAQKLLHRRSLYTQTLSHRNKMQPTNPNAHTYLNGTDVETHGYAVTQCRTLFCNSLFKQP